jgi:hypothetical protein
MVGGVGEVAAGSRQTSGPLVEGNSAAPRSAYPVWIAAEIASGTAPLRKSCRTAAEARSREAESSGCALAMASAMPARRLLASTKRR